MKTVSSGSTSCLALAGVLTVSLGLSLAGCQRTEQAKDQAASSVGAVVDDSVLTTKVKSALIADTATSGTDVKVETHQGEVQLSGFVDSQAQADRAVLIARGIDGVKKVKNDMSVKPGGAGTASIGSKIDDTVVTTKVKSALLADPDVRSLDISVVTKDGEVQLSGFVESQTQLAKAADVARSVEGVQKVNNQLALKK
jgi:hyperosmotically inducible periplasmic protein